MLETINVWVYRKQDYYLSLIAHRLIEKDKKKDAK
jgi:hypothetical protein